LHKYEIVNRYLVERRTSFRRMIFGLPESYREALVPADLEGLKPQEQWRQGRCRNNCFAAVPASAESSASRDIGM